MATSTSPAPPVGSPIAASAGRFSSEETPGPFGLDLLEFELPEFNRTSWVSDRARETWAPRLSRIFEAWMKLETLAVVDGVRACGVSSVAAEELPAVAAGNARLGLSTLPVAIQRATNYTYNNVGVAPVLGEPFLYRVAVGTPSNVAALQAAWDACDEEAIGELLGYPKCCRRFFHEVWVDHGLRDTTWPMAVASAGRLESSRVLEVQGPPQANILWRWMGVRAVSHLPCRFDCAATVELADRLLQVGRAHGFGEEVDWMLEILSWPVEWSCLHGIAEIKTPLLKVSANTDATGSKYVVRRRGDRYPEEGAKGLSFAFRLPKGRRLTTSNRYRAGLENPLPILEE